jgi:hypothetical protein
MDLLHEYKDGYVDLPQIVVVGDQSTSKSSVLEALCKIPFPTKSTKCTRYVTQVRFRRDERTETSIQAARRSASDEKQRLAGFKQRRCRVDTGCHTGNWVSKDPLLDLLGPTQFEEALVSAAVTGTYQWTWTAYGFFDTYFESNESVNCYDELKSFTGWPDPLDTDEVANNSPTWEPREYFLKVLKIRMKGIRREWGAIVAETESVIKKCVLEIPLSPS